MTELQMNDVLQQRPAPLEYTGERMVPEATESSTFWEHVYRYRFAARLARGRDVLDVACGEGYGSAALLKAGASSVIGVDVSHSVCDHARKKYGIDARCGDACSLPLRDTSIDLVASFETIEHVAVPEDLVRECSRVLRQRGILVISTPNRDVYLEGAAPNPFHCSEMNRDEFVSLLGAHFRSVRLYTQGVKFSPWWTLQSLRATDSPWCRLRGYGRLRKWLLPLGIQNMADVSRQERLDVEGTLLRRDGMLSDLFNQFAVRGASISRQERPVYYVAVCRGPKRS